MADETFADLMSRATFKYSKAGDLLICVDGATFKLNQKKNKTLLELSVEQGWDIGQNAMPPEVAKWINDFLAAYKEGKLWANALVSAMAKLKRNAETGSTETFYEVALSDPHVLATLDPRILTTLPPSDLARLDPTVLATLGSRSVGPSGPRDLGPVSRFLSVNDKGQLAVKMVYLGTDEDGVVRYGMPGDYLGIESSWYPGKDKQIGYDVDNVLGLPDESSQNDQTVIELPYTETPSAENNQSTNSNTSTPGSPTGTGGNGKINLVDNKAQDMTKPENNSGARIVSGQTVAKQAQKDEKHTKKGKRLLTSEQRKARRRKPRQTRNNPSKDDKAQKRLLAVLTAHYRKEGTITSNQRVVGMANRGGKLIPKVAKVTR
ncbi:MAG: hypothetical protein ILP11_04670 [Alphaproteobacteria bacterium]|nr:hypothetical protein [Alphaproteobacteria bacterium]